MSIIKANGAGDQDTGFYNGVVSNSVRLNGSDTHFRRTLSQGGDRRQATYSFWLKHGDDGNTNYNPIIFSKGNNVPYSDSIYLQIRTTSQGGDIYMTGYLDDSQQALIVTNRKFRDPSAWYHFVLAFDTEQSTNTDRMKLYVNGVQETDFSSVTYPSQNADMAFGYYGSNSGNDEVIGDYDAGESSTYHINGCLAEFHYVDGQQLTPTSFGEFKNGVWIPKKYTGSHGTIGYHLKFDQTGVGSGASNTVGADSSGNNNHFDSSGIADHDCNFPDTPENNFCTLNPIGRRYGQSYVATYSEGNLKFVSGGNATNVFGTMAINEIASEGGVYFELRFDSIDSVRTYFGVIGDNGVNNKNPNTNSGGYTFPIKGMLSSTPRGYFTTDTDASNSVDLTANSAFSNGDVAGIAILSDGKFFVHRNGTYLNDASGNTGNPSTGANPIGTIDLTEGDWLPYLGYSSSYSANFGQDPTFAGSETAPGTDKNDANGIGRFLYDVPTNCLSICSSNMVEPTIGPSSSTQAEDHHGTLTYTSDGNAVNIVSGGNDNNGTAVGGEINFSPDWVWIKRRNASNNHQLFDTNRGTNVLQSNEYDDESDYSSYFAFLSSSNGFRLPAASANMNANGGTYVAWNWKANGGTTSSDSNGSITSTVQANTDAGFSIVTYAGTGASSATIGHGLGAVPKQIWVKNRDATYNWKVYHGENTTAPETDYLVLDTNDDTVDASSHWNDTPPTSTVFSIGSSGALIRSSDNFVAYCFAEIKGYSKFGSFHGNGSTDGTFVYTGFRPAYLLYKRSDSSGNWLIDDNVTQSFNPDSNYLVADTADLEGDTTTNTAGHVFDMLSNGFKMRNTNSARNASGGLYVYMAFADIPFKFANAR